MQYLKQSNRLLDIIKENQDYSYKLQERKRQTRKRNTKRKKGSINDFT